MAHGAAPHSPDTPFLPELNLQEPPWGLEKLSLVSMGAQQVAGSAPWEAAGNDVLPWALTRVELAKSAVEQQALGTSSCPGY